MGRCLTPLCSAFTMSASSPDALVKRMMPEKFDYLKSSALSRSAGSESTISLQSRWIPPPDCLDSICPSNSGYFLVVSGLARPIKARSGPWFSIANPTDIARSFLTSLARIFALMEANRNVAYGRCATGSELLPNGRRYPAPSRSLSIIDSSGSICPACAQPLRLSLID